MDVDSWTKPTELWTALHGEAEATPSHGSDNFHMGFSTDHFTLSSSKFRIEGGSNSWSTTPPDDLVLGRTITISALLLADGI